MQGTLAAETADNRRRWAGTTLDARRAQRRDRLIDAGLELLGTDGAGAVSVRSVCRGARLTDRYFYESFADRSELLLAVYDRVAEQAAACLVHAAQGAGADIEASAHAAVEAFLAFLTDDPRKGRVLLLEPLTDPVLGVRGVALAPMFAEIIRERLAPASSPMQASLTATALVGALANLFIRWLDDSVPAARAELADYCVRLLLSASALAAGSVDDR